jgi:hypothetical protein
MRAKWTVTAVDGNAPIIVQHPEISFQVEEDSSYGWLD